MPQCFDSPKNQINIFYKMYFIFSGALCFTELGTLIPESGDTYSYLRVTIGPIPAFLHSWTATLALRPGGIAAISLTCAEYVLTPVFLDDCGQPPDFIKKIIACLVIC